VLKRIVILAVLVSLTVPAVSIARDPAGVLIKRAIGPGTVVSNCHAHGGGTVICAYSTPVRNLGMKTEDSAARWHSYAVVEDGRVRT
jgi:hypothetical protein